MVCPPFTFMGGLIARAGALQAVMSDLTLEEEMQIAMKMYGILYVRYINHYHVHIIYMAYSFLI